MRSYEIKYDYLTVFYFPSVNYIFQTVRVIQTVQEAVAVASIGVVKSSCLYSVQECIKIRNLEKSNLTR